MGFSSVIEGEDSEEDWKMRFASMEEGVGLGVQNEGSWIDTLFIEIRCVAETGKYIP